MRDTNVYCSSARNSTSCGRNSVVQDLDEVVESCQARFPEMRRKHDNTRPDGVLVFDSAGSEVRRWFVPCLRGKALR